MVEENQDKFRQVEMKREEVITKLTQTLEQKKADEKVWQAKPQLD